MANEVKWTEEQKQAIYEKNNNILVAAVGSGKTAVLVERIINKIINENQDDYVMLTDIQGLEDFLLDMDYHIK